MGSVKVILYLVASIIMAATIFIVPKIAGVVAIFYVSILSTYLGLDVMGMIKTTRLMPSGKFEKLHVGRYILCAVSYVVLVIIGYFKTLSSGINMDPMFSVFISAIFLLIALLIGGLEGNKIVTNEGPTSPPVGTQGEG